jgi:RHS repeat-associated protein
MREQAESNQRFPIDLLGRGSYYRARYYDSGSGRFISEDPLRWGSGINFLAYVQNRTPNMVDPTGLDDQCPWWVPNWVCNLWKKQPQTPTRKSCLCTRTDRAPQPSRPGSLLKVCVYSCDCSSKPQVILLQTIRKLQDCKDIDFCPYQLVADVDTTGSSSTAYPDRNIAPTLDPPKPGDIVLPK